jgi:hypothetical protein
MRHAMNFHPEWGCLAPAPSFLRTMRTVLVATAVGATAGGGVVLSLVGQSAGRTSVAERTLVRPIPAVSTSVSAPQTAQLNPQPLNQRVSTEVSLDEGQVDGSATNELSANSPARLAVVAASAEVGTAPEGTLKTAVAPSPATQKHSIQVAQRARHKDAVSSSRQPQHSVAPQTAPNVAERFFSGLTAAIEHVWPSQRLPANRTSRASGNNPSGSLT